MTAIKTNPAASTDPSPVRYHVTDNSGNHAQMSQATVAAATPNAQNAAPAKVLVLSSGGNTVVLTQQNVADLSTAFSAFGSSGTLS